MKHFITILNTQRIVNVMQLFLKMHSNPYDYLLIIILWIMSFVTTSHTVSYTLLLSATAAV